MANEETIKKPSVRLWHGVLACFICAIISELLFTKFSQSSVSPIIRIILLSLVLFIIHYFAFVSTLAYGKHLKDVVFINSVAVVFLALIAIVRFTIEAVTHSLGEMNYLGIQDQEILFFIIPFATGALLVQAVLGMSYSLVFSINLAMVIGFYFPDEIVFIPYVLISSLVASLSLRRFRSRSDYVRAGCYIVAVSIPFAVAALAKLDMFNVVHIIMAILAASIGGMMCSFIAAGVTPIVEHLCGYVTDMRLIEMATLDHPLLKELSLSAPGTWNHSMVIGMMVEAAADAIGANPVLARVGAYFHDIGKSKKPLYFVENQTGGENRHDKLSTSMSTLIIKSHVKDGVDLARKYNIPEPVVDMIAQHHGTSLIEYFYDKAVKEAAEAGSETPVDRSQFMYAGPKPQTKEAAILMLADGVEAASRTISEPTPDRIQGLVQKMINKVFASGELSECELTLQDLHQIAKTFNRVLNGIYHQRIAYAEPAEKVAEKNQVKPVEVAEENKKEEKSDKAPQEDLKRLGI